MRGFLGFPIEENFGARLSRVSQEWRSLPGLRPVPAADLHLTTKFLGDFSTVEFYHHLPDFLALGAPPSRAFTVGEIAVWPTVVALECVATEAAAEWQVRWNDRLERKGFLRERHPVFRPHVTLARWQGSSPPAGIAGVLEKDRQRFEELPLPVGALALFQSQAEETGRRHRPFMSVWFSGARG